MQAYGTGPTMMFEHCLDELKGWPDESALDFDAFLETDPLATETVTVDPIYGGSCVHVNANGNFVLGVSPTSMGIFLLQGSHELDVNNAGGNNWTPIAPTGKMSGLVATGAYELETTEFDLNSTFVPGDQLTSPPEASLPTGAGADHTMAGKLFNKRNWLTGAAPGTPGTGAKITNQTDPICAVVSRGSHVNHNRVMVVSFWPVYLPKTT